MGRWAQRRRRGGGGATTPPPPPSGAILLQAFDGGGGVVRLAFDRTVTPDNSACPDLGAFTLDGNPVNVTAASQPFLTVIDVLQTVSPSAGMTAGWLSQPPYILEPVDISVTVVIT